MKVLLLDIKARSTRKCINKSLAGGMGTGTWIGDSLRARIFEYVKKKNVNIPIQAIAYIAAIFKKAGWEVKIIEIRDNIDFSENADLVLINTSIVDCNHELEIAKKIKQKGFYTGVYGTFATVMPEFFSESVDFVVRGEPEAGIMKILSNNNLPKGIVEGTLIENLDSLPFPDWDQFSVNKYSYSPALNEKPVLPVVTSRGCPYLCYFYCAYPINYGKRWRSRSVENVISEMEYLKKRYKIKAIDFKDPIFTLNRQRILDLANRLIEKKLGIIWSCETRLDCLDKGLIEVMHKAGLHNINVGIESSSADVLKSSQRLPIEKRHQEDIINYCHKLGVTVAVFYILGLEDDTEESIINTIAYAKKLNTLVAQFAINTPYPGTCFFEKLKIENRIIDFNWENYDEYTPVFKHNSLSSERLLFLKEKAFVSYFFRLPYLIKHMPKFFFRKFLRPFLRSIFTLPS